MSVPMQFAASAFNQMAQDFAPKFTMGSKRHALISVLVIAIPVFAYFGWLYYREWKQKRAFRRYWEGRRRSPAE